MENNPIGATGIDPNALLAGTKSQAERQRILITFHDLARNPDSLAAKDAIMLLAVARSAQDAAERNEATAKRMETAAARVEAAAGRNEASSGKVADSVTQRVSTELDATIDRRFQAAGKANQAIREKQNEELERKFEAIRQNPGRVAMWNAITVATAVVITWMLVKGLDDTAMSKERADLTARLHTAYAAGWDAHAATTVTAQSAPATAPEPARIKPLSIPESIQPDRVRRALPVH